MVAYYLADTPAHRALAARLGVALPQLCEHSFAAAHRQVVAELAFAVTDTFSDGDQTAARQLADTLTRVLDWHEPATTAAADQPYLAGPDRHGEHYAVIRIDYPPTERPAS